MFDINSAETSIYTMQVNHLREEKTKTSTTQHDQKIIDLDQKISQIAGQKYDAKITQVKNLSFERDHWIREGKYSKAVQAVEGLGKVLGDAFNVPQATAQIYITHAVKLEEQRCLALLRKKERGPTRLLAFQKPNNLIS